jgi:hypothetical protein
MEKCATLKRAAAKHYEEFVQHNDAAVKRRGRL